MMGCRGHFVAMLTVEVARGLAFSAPIRRGHGDRTLLAYWGAAAATVVGLPSVPTGLPETALRDLLL